MDKETAAVIQASGVELGAELEQEVLQSTIQEPVAKEPITVPAVSEVEQRLNALTEVEPEVVEPEVEQARVKTDDPTDDLMKAWEKLDPDSVFNVEKEPLALPETPEAQKFAEDFKQYLGFDVTELREGVQSFQQMQKEIQTYRAQKAVDKQLSDLKSEWKIDGADFDARMEKVVERFGKLPQGERDKFDSIEGTKFIWARIEQEERAKNDKSKSVPTFEKSRSKSTPGAKPVFTQAEIDGMSMEQYERNADKIAYAYANGLVKK